MAFQIHYKVPFVSLRNGTHYVVNIWKDGAPSGGLKTLSGAASPFVTQEDDNEDIFCDIRTQTGYVRIVSADASDLWTAIAPATDTDTPVTLTVGQDTTPVWQGFIQSQTYGHDMYGDPQELEFPVMCMLSALKSKQISVGNVAIRNFAYLLKYIVDEINTLGNGVAVITGVVVGGGADARQWLLKKFDWQNFVSEQEGEYDTAKYNIYSVLEDMCKFWGWTARTCGQALYLTNADDEDEQSLLELTYAQLTTLSTATTDTQTGSEDTPQTWNIPQVSGTNPFVSIDNEESQLCGPNKAVVQADCNAEDTIIKFAPKQVRDELELNTTWEWVGSSDEELEHTIGYFGTNPVKSEFGLNNVMSGSSNTGGGFCRRQIFSSEEQKTATKADLILAEGFNATTQFSSLTVRRWHNYGGGSLSVKGNIFQGYKQFEAGDDSWFMFIRLGIGETRGTAKWYKLTCDAYGNIFSSWEDSPQLLAIHINGNGLQGFTAYKYNEGLRDIDWGTFSSIPVDAGLSGHLYVDFMGFHSYNGGNSYGEVADFEVTFSRDETFIQNNTKQHRPRTMSEDRVDRREYESVNQGKADNEWNADCIFASDNNMEYGYGLLMNADGTWMGKVPYDITTNYPEQHLADRVASFWQYARRMIRTEVKSSEASGVNPSTKVNMKSLTLHPMSISHDWREDTIQLIMIEL